MRNNIIVSQAAWELFNEIDLNTWRATLSRDNGARWSLVLASAAADRERAHLKDIETLAELAGAHL